MHVRLCNILDDNRNIKVPCSNGLVVGSRNKSSVVINKGNGIDGAQMLVILLGNLPGIDIVLTPKSKSQLAYEPARRHVPE